MVLTPAEASRVAVLVVNYGSHGLLADNLAALSSSVPGLRVVVTDNHTSLEERQAVSTLAGRHGWDAVLLDTNVGFGAGVNRAAEAAPSEVDTFVMLNPDAVLDVDSLTVLVEHARAHPRDLAAPQVRRPDGGSWSSGSDLVLETGQMRGWRRRPADALPASYQPWLSGACLAVSRTLWDEVGGFDEDYFLYWEDVDLSRRVLGVGGELALLDTATAVHDEGGTHRRLGETRAKSPVYYYYSARNRLVFAAKHLPPDARRRWLRSSGSAGIELLSQGGRRQLVHPMRTVVPVVRGIRDGRRVMSADTRIG